MLTRFCLYGFLKNQRYFEPFLLLAFLEKGLTYFEIGLLVAFREITVAVLEIPSGAVADVFGRRRSLMLSFAAYFFSFLVFGLADSKGPLWIAMALFAVGDSFRTGTHKALIFAWLRLEGREDERTTVYGLTRSWSKFGSAISALVAAGFVLATGSYGAIFYFSMVPCALSLVNFLGYPEELEEARPATASPQAVARHVGETLRLSFFRPPLRRLLVEAAGFEGTFHAVKDYLQPVLEVAAVTWLAGSIANEDWAGPRTAALLVAPVYFSLHVLSALASRRAHRVVSWAGDEEKASQWMWKAVGLVYLAVLAACWFGTTPALVTAFIALYVLQNTWRPVLVSRFDSWGEESKGATLLSIESLSRRIGTMILAPLLGAVLDRAVDSNGILGFWPIGALGLAVSLPFAFAKPSERKSR